MQQNVQDIAAQTAELAKRHGAQEARVRVRRERYVQFKRIEQALAQIEESGSMELNLSLFVDGRFSSHVTNDVRPEALETFLKNAVIMTRYLTPDPHRTLPASELYQGYQPQDLRLVDAGYEAVDTDARAKLVLQLEQEVLKAGKPLSNLETLSYDTVTEGALVNTNGFSGYQRSTEFWTGIDLTADDREGRKATYGDYAGRRMRQDLPTPAELATRTLERLLLSMGAHPIKTRRLPMVVENRVAGRLVGMLLEPMSGSALQQRQSFLEGKQGQSIASPVLTVIDDPFVSGAMGSILYDPEGIPTQRRVMIEKGVLKEYWVDVYYAHKLGRKPTTGGPSNLVFTPGDRDAAGLMKQAGKGILVTSFLGGNSNATTGDFSLGVKGFYFENGKIGQPVQEMNIAGNHLEFWKRLVALGNDPYLNSSSRTPSVLFDDILFSGV